MAPLYLALLHFPVYDKNGHVVTTAGISAGIDGSLHVVARLLGRRIADDVATYMEYHWTPESSLASEYPYLNPSTNDQGRLAQTADMQNGDKDFAGAAATYRKILRDAPSNRDAWAGLAFALNARKDYVGSAQAFVRSVEGTADMHTGYGYYNAATQYALAHRNDDAVAMLKKAFDAGFRDRDAVAQDPDLASLRADPRVKEIVAAH